MGARLKPKITFMCKGFQIPIPVFKTKILGSLPKILSSSYHDEKLSVEELALGLERENWNYNGRLYKNRKRLELHHNLDDGVEWFGELEILPEDLQPYVHDKLRDLECAIKNTERRRLEFNRIAPKYSGPHMFLLVAELYQAGWRYASYEKQISSK